jgi:hypothetical protein
METLALPGKPVEGRMSRAQGRRIVRNDARQYAAHLFAGEVQSNRFFKGCFDPFQVIRSSASQLHAFSGVQAVFPLFDSLRMPCSLQAIKFDFFADI